MIEHSDLVARIERLEKRNRSLSVACLALALLGIVGWQAAGDAARFKRIEIVNAQNVPLITLEPSRTGEGGSVVLRDSMGEKRAWWEVGPERGALTLNSSKPDGSNDTTLGLQVGPKNARMAIISKGGAMLSTSMEGDSPQVELTGAAGKPLFSAPWKKN